MKRAFVATLAVATVASLATPGLAGFVSAPTGWREQQDLAAAIAVKAKGVSHFGATTTEVSARAFVPTDGPGALYVTTVSARLDAHRNEAARVEVDSFLAAARRAGLASTKVSIGKSASFVDARKRALEVTLDWRDGEAGSDTRTRLLIVADATSIVAVTGECVFGPDTTPSSQDGCTKALMTLDPGIPLDRRVELALAPEGTELPAPAASRTTTLSHQTMTEPSPSRTPLPPISVPGDTKREADKRPMYVGLGIVLLAAVFWWNRRRREGWQAEGSNDDDQR